MIPLRNMSDNVVAVFGLGRSGRSAAHALMQSGATVRASDDDPERCTAAAEEGIPVVDLMAMNWEAVGSLVLSPGVPLTHPAPHPVVQCAQKADVEIIGDIELLFRSTAGVRKTVITGTNGKSTTTALLHHILQAAGRNVQVGGNLGIPVLNLEYLDGDGDYVLEVSSYQIDLTPSLCADIAVLLNITPDHLDRHGSMERYVAIKKRLLTTQTPDGVAIIGIDDDICAGIYDELRRTGSQVIVPISVGTVLEFGAYVVDGVLFDTAGGSGAKVADLRDAIGLPGVHNWQNAAAAYMAAQSIGMNADDIVAGLMSFPGLANRMETVAEAKGVRFVNDSKATNADAAARALACFDKIYWIAGGQAKKGGITSLAPFFSRIRRAFLIGESSDEFAATMQGRVPFEISHDLATATQAAWQAALKDGEPHSVVLLSPACASFDQFADFEARGDEFRQVARRLVGGADA